MDEPRISELDQRWIDALRLHLGTGVVPVDVPIWMRPDGSVDAAKTVDNFCQLKGWRGSEGG